MSGPRPSHPPASRGYPMTEARDSHPLSACASTGLPQPQSHDCLPLQGARSATSTDRVTPNPKPPQPHLHGRIRDGRQATRDTNPQDTERPS